MHTIKLWLRADKYRGGGDSLKGTLKKIQRFFQKKKNVSLTKNELELIKQSLQNSAYFPGTQTEYNELIKYLEKYKFDSAQKNAIYQYLYDA